MERQQNAAPRLVLLSGVLGLAGTVNCVLGLVANSLPVAIIGGMTGLPSLLLSRYYRREYQVTATEVVVAMGQVLDDFDIAVNDVDNFPDLGPAIARRLRPMRTLVLEDLAPASWVSNEFWSWSTVYIGEPGTSKSVNLKHHVDMLVKAHGLDCLWAICDPHYDPDEEKPIDTWLNGIPREQVPARKSGEDAFAALKAFHQEFKRRMAGNLKTETIAAIVIDEFQDCIPKDRREQALEWIGEIVRGGRKFGMRIYLGMHSPKKGENGIDSSVLWPMTAVIMGMTVGDSTVSWPQDIKANSKELIATLKAQIASSPTARFTTAVVRPGSFSKLPFSTAQVKTLPDRSQCQVNWVFDDAPWIDQVRAKVDAALEDGSVTSFTGLCKLLKLHGHMGRDKKTGNYRDERVRVLFSEYGDRFNV